MKLQSLGTPPTVFQSKGGNDVLITSCSHECTQSFEAADAQHQKRRHQVPKRDVFHEARKTHANHTSTRSFSPISQGRAGGSKNFPPQQHLERSRYSVQGRSVEHVQGRQGKIAQCCTKSNPKRMLKFCLLGGWTRPTLFTQGNKELSLRDVCLIAKGVKQPNRGE